MATTTTTTLTRSESAGVTVLRLAGPLTHDTVPSVRPAFDAATQAPARVVVDLSEVPVLTTPGLSLLLTATRRLSEGGGRLVITGTQGIVDDMLRRCRLDVVLDMIRDAGDAFRKAQQGASASGGVVG
jgi:anti-anti-sigma factor